MLEKLKRKSSNIGLFINLSKTKAEEYVYLGHNIKLGNENYTTKIKRQVRLTWAATSKMS